MNLNDIVKKSIFSSIGTLLKDEDIHSFIRYVNYNKGFIEKFPYIIYSFNGDKSLVDRAEMEVKSIFPNSVIEFIFSENLGHTFGIFLSENLIFKRTNELKDFAYVWKFSNDTIATEEIFNATIESSDFYYISNIGYAAFDEFGGIEGVIKSIKDKTLFYPQTNYYIIKNGIDFYPKIDTIYYLHRIYKEKNDTSLKPWDVIKGCACEEFLRETIQKNNLSSYMLLNDNELMNIASLVDKYKMWDGSHKNVSYRRLGSLCHFQWPNMSVMSI